MNLRPLCDSDPRIARALCEGPEGSLIPLDEVYLNAEHLFPWPTAFELQKIF